MVMPTVRLTLSWWATAAYLGVAVSARRACGFLLPPGANRARGSRSPSWLAQRLRWRKSEPGVREDRGNRWSSSPWR